jgi:predicted DNA-binding transcriptional regulator AlpA
LTPINIKEADMTDTNTADVLISAKAVLNHFDPPPSVRTLDRWLADPRIEFPRPVMLGGGKRRYFIEREISDFIARKARERVTFKT